MHSDVSSGHLINSRWLRIPEDAIYRLFVGRGSTWASREVCIGGQARHYLASIPYAYPYSLPIDVIARLAHKLNEGRLMFDPQYWLDEIRENPGLNDTGGQVAVSAPEGATWIVSGVHKLIPSEQPQHPTIFFDVRCKTDNRDGMKPVYWKWEGMRPDQTPGPVFVDKPPYEVGNIGIMPGMNISIWLDNGGRAFGFQQPDSYFVVFQEIDEGSGPDPDPPSPPDPDPPSLETKGIIELSIDRDFFNSQSVDENNMVHLTISIKENS